MKTQHLTFKNTVKMVETSNPSPFFQLKKSRFLSKAVTSSVLAFSFLVTSPQATAAKKTEAKTSGLQTFAVMGDAGNINEDHLRVRRSLERHDVMQMILPGDNLYNPQFTYADIWDPWKARGFTFPIVAIGNHNISYREEMRYFRMPAEFYSRTSGDVRFIVLNSDNETNVAEQLRFLKSELTYAKERFVFLVFHHPTFTISERHSWQEKKEFQVGIRKALLQYKNRITALIVGHDHIATLIDVNGIPIIVSGANFEQIPTRPRLYKDGPFQVQTRWLFRSGPQWARLDIDPTAPHVWLNFINADTNSVACSARLYPRPIELRENCSRTNSRVAPVRIPNPEITTENDD